MSYVVTGGSGFIGSHVIEALTNSGYTVTNLDIREVETSAHRYVKADIRDLKTLTDVFSQHGRDGVFHIAAIADARQALADPIKTMDVNITGTACVLEAARRAEVARVILASTVWYYNAANHIYDPNQSAREEIRYLDESEPISPRGGGHIYTTSKITSEVLCQDFHRLYGLDFTILRYGIPYGPRMWPGLVLRSFLEYASSGKPIRIFGDGSAVRRFIYVEDLANAHVLALKDIARNQIYNLEGKRDVSVKELAETLAQFVPGLKVEHVVDVSRRGELNLESVVISNHKALKELGWSPTTELEEGVRRVVDWYYKEIMVTSNAENNSFNRVV